MGCADCHEVIPSEQITDVQIKILDSLMKNFLTKTLCLRAFVAKHF
jgi:hypothetical protein